MPQAIPTLPPFKQFRSRATTESRADILKALRRTVLDDARDVPHGLRVRDWELVAATAHYLRVGSAFRAGGLKAALPLVPPVNCSRPIRSGHDPVTAFYARDAAWRVAGLARTFGGEHLCLHESLGTCAALRGLGSASEAVVGYPVIELADGNDELHAWPALGSIPLNGRPGGQPPNYIEMVRYPKEEATSCS